MSFEPDLTKKCGGVCHTDGTFTPTPPKFLEGPDAYKSIKAHPGIVMRDVYQSALLTKGPHAGPAVSSDPEFEKKVIAWLEAESFAIQSPEAPHHRPGHPDAGRQRHRSLEGVRQRPHGCAPQVPGDARWRNVGARADDHRGACGHRRSPLQAEVREGPRDAEGRRHDRDLRPGRQLLEHGPDGAGRPGDSVRHRLGSLQR